MSGQGARFHAADSSFARKRFHRFDCCPTVFFFFFLWSGRGSLRTSFSTRKSALVSVQLWWIKAGVIIELAPGINWHSVRAWHCWCTWAALVYVVRIACLWRIMRSPPAHLPASGGSFGEGGGLVVLAVWALLLLRIIIYNAVGMCTFYILEHVSASSSIDVPSQGSVYRSDTFTRNLVLPLALLTIQIHQRP